MLSVFHFHINWWRYIVVILLLLYYYKDWRSHYSCFLLYTEWTQALTKYLREHLLKIMEYYQGTSTGGSGPPSSSQFLINQPVTVIDLDLSLNHWNYGTQLAQFMYGEGLLDRQEFLSWMVELLEKGKIADDTVLKLVLGQVFRVCVHLTSYSKGFTEIQKSFCFLKVIQVWISISTSLCR